jgi:hypothetical protein
MFRNPQALKLPWERMTSGGGLNLIRSAPEPVAQCLCFTGSAKCAQKFSFEISRAGRSLRA